VQFSAANLVTFVVYAALGGALFLLPLQLQLSLGYSPLLAGAALVPLTVVMLLLSARAGRLAQRIGPRLPMGLGPIVAGIGLALLALVQPGSGYVQVVLPGVLVFSLGLSFTVAPLTATVLNAGGEEHAGVSSAINNDIARVAGLIAVALIPVVSGISGDDYRNPTDLTDGYRIGMVICAVLCAFGGVLALLTIRGGPSSEAGPEPLSSCPLDAPPPSGGPLEPAAPA
jgi:MFS family permease